MPRCAVASCRNSMVESDAIIFHRFPLGNRSNLENWITNMKLSELNPPLSTYVCNTHFSSSCYEKGKLKKDAIPLVIDSEYENDTHLVNNTPSTASLFEKKCGSFLCRICASRLSEDELISLFEDAVIEKLRCCLSSIFITKHDDLPSHICKYCVSEIETVFKFRALSTVTDIILSHYSANLMDVNDIDDSSNNKQTNGSRRSGHEELPLSGPVTCNLCNFEFVEMAQFDWHMEKYHFSDLEISSKKLPSDCPNMVCSTCGLIFCSKTDYNEHKQQMKYECKKCEQVIFSKCERKKHDCKRELLNFISDEMENMHELSDDETFKMEDEKDESKKIVKNQGSLQRGFKCDDCGKIFLRCKNLVKHKARHERGDETSNVRCNICDEHFSKAQLLTQHREKVHKVGSVWICRFCGKHTTTKLSLNIHERIHTGVKPFVCEWCGNTFRSKANLSQHHAKHTGERRHACPLCSKMFSRRSFVKTHMRVHTGERPFACDLCNQRFTQVGDMRRHRRRHQETAAAASAEGTSVQIEDGHLYQLTNLIPAIIIQNVET